VLQILDAIEYKEDKKTFVEDFIRITNSQALVDLVQSLPTEKQTEADKEIAEADSQESFQKAVQKYFTDAQVEEAINWLFDWIVTLRSGGFIVGEFVGPPDWESRLSALERRVSSIEKLFEELGQRLKVLSPPG